MPNIYRISEQHKAKLIARERRASMELVDAYAVAYRQIQTSIEALTLDIEAARVSGVPVSSSWLFERDRMSRLQGEIEAEMRGFSRKASERVTAQQSFNFEAGATDAKDLLIQSKGASVAAELGGLDARAVEAIAGFASDGSPLRALFDELGKSTSRRVRDELIAGVARGAGARVIASRIKDAFGGDLARALTIARTESIRAYREATHEMYKASARVLDGWQWSSTLTVRTCAMCFAMHGRVFPVGTRMSSHPSCRCVMLPLTKGAKRIETGAGQFAELEAGAQREILGAGKHELYKAGRLELSDLIGERVDARWGFVRRELSLREVLGK